MTLPNTARKSRQVPTALLAESLLQKSKTHASRATNAKQNEQDEDYQLYSALALELLAKAALAEVHPSLVVKNDNLNSLLEANGIATGTVVRTIDASEAYARLRHVVPQFTTLDVEACRRLADRRNAELHSGEAAFAAFPPALWEAEFWHASELILKSMDLTLDDWLGADASAPKKLLSALRKAKSAAIRQRIERARAAFQEFKPDGKKKRSARQIKQIIEQSSTIEPSDFRDRFAYIGDRSWLEPCPACGASGVVEGERAYQEVAQDQSGADPGYEIIESSYYPIEFHCPTCGLDLDGSDEVHIAAIARDGHYEFEEREISYEPEYGND